MQHEMKIVSGMMPNGEWKAILHDNGEPVLQANGVTRAAAIQLLMEYWNTPNAQQRADHKRL